MRSFLKKIRNMLGWVVHGYLAISLLAALSLEGRVREAKTDAGQYFLLLRVGRRPAEWVETTALRFWFETALDMAFFGVVLCCVIWAVIYCVWRQWRKSQGLSAKFD
ncbi:MULTISPECIES: hypothetical protein [unclassified Leisingera]|uniref:hypothetical protein n=1 Tax=unclassified Leisingera TaxID=2614906 RepID=UPI00057F6481|nr:MULTISPECIES: hypothetical protein [unclassified Leisingera]KIC23679.1 hypothetical protein RA24_21310 [Leisingera sp. ANG-M6]KIC30429.1 hypothetical protein RA25_18665 [Leisingera sp. ANG-S5]